MGTDDTSLDGADTSAPVPAAAEPASASPSAAAPAPPTTVAPAPAPSSNRSRVWRWLGVAVCVGAVAAAAAAVVAYGQATDDKRAAERDVVQARRSLADETARADAAEAEADTQETRADDAEAAAEQLGRDLEDRGEEIEARDEEIEDYRSSTAEFLAISVEFGLGASSSDATCIAEAFVEDRGADALSELVKSFTVGSTDLDADLIGYADGCGVDPDSLTPAPAIETGFAYGDNPTLDGLWDGCAAGDGQACDDLYLSSESGSEYEQFGLTCGDRFTAAEAPESCVGEI